MGGGDIKTCNNGGLMMFVFVLKYVHLWFFYDFTSFFVGFH